MALVSDKTVSASGDSIYNSEERPPWVASGSRSIVMPAKHRLRDCCYSASSRSTRIQINVALVENSSQR